MRHPLVLMQIYVLTVARTVFCRQAYRLALGERYGNLYHGVRGGDNTMRNLHRGITIECFCDGSRDPRVFRFSKQLYWKIILRSCKILCR